MRMMVCVEAESTLSVLSSPCLSLFLSACVSLSLSSLSLPTIARGSVRTKCQQTTTLRECFWLKGKVPRLEGKVHRNRSAATSAFKHLTSPVCVLRDAARATRITQMKLSACSAQPLDPSPPQGSLRLQQEEARAAPSLQPHPAPDSSDPRSR